MHRLEKTRAFLTEFIIVILFFTVSAVITVQLFAEAGKKSLDSMNITDCYIRAEGMAEEMKSAIYRGGMEELDRYMISDTGAGYMEDGQAGYYIQYFDKEYNTVDAGDVYITGCVNIVRENMDAGSLYNVTVEFKDAKSIVSRIDFSIYRGEAQP